MSVLGQLARTRHAIGKWVAATAVVAVAAGAVFLASTERAAAQRIGGPDAVADVNSCSISSVTIARTPMEVRIQKQFADGSSVITLDGAFASVPAGHTFHITHVFAMLFTDGPQVGQVRLYRDGSIIEAFNLTDTALHMENSTIQSKTLNQPVDLNLAISNDPGQYDLQLIRQKSNGIATGIAEFWGYLTTDSCQTRG